MQNNCFEKPCKGEAKVWKVSFSCLVLKVEAATAEEEESEDFLKGQAGFLHLPVQRAVGELGGGERIPRKPDRGGRWKYT